MFKRQKLSISGVALILGLVAALACLQMGVAAEDHKPAKAASQNGNHGSGHGEVPAGTARVSVVKPHKGGLARTTTSREPWNPSISPTCSQKSPATSKF